MYFARRPLIGILLIGLLLTSCGGQAAGEPTPDIDATIGAAAETMVAALFQTQTALAPAATATATVTPLPTGTPLTLLSPVASVTPLAFNTLIPGLFPSPTGTQYTPTPNQANLAYGCNNLLLLRDVNYAAGTVVKPKESFTKKWQVANTGTCDWVYLYHLVFVSGNAMGGEPKNLRNVFQPGKWTTLEIGLVAPKEPGTYTSYWRLGDQSGNMFGSTLGVSIVVTAPTKTPVPPTSYP